MNLSLLEQGSRQTALDSSCLRLVTFSDRVGTMDITFKDGSVYRYFGVPIQVYHALVNATSKGSYFSVEIRPKFRFDRVR